LIHAAKREWESVMTEYRAPEPPQFPAGPFVVEKSHDDPRRATWIREIELAPTQLRQAVSGLSETQIDTKYRNWTIRQIAHHLADSHLVGYVRFKLALTEDRPMIKTWDETRWSQLADAQRHTVEASLAMLDGLHERWAHLLRSLQPDAFERSFLHPETGEMPLWRVLALFAWHGHHHTAQIEWVRKYKLSVPQHARGRRIEGQEL
jgi:uncharacterized damage-inducible protein DinB